MPITTWRSYAPKVRKRPKSDFREYIRAETCRPPREAKYSYCDEQSWEIETQEKEKVNEEWNQNDSPQTHQGGHEGVQEATLGRQEVEESSHSKEKEEVKLRPPIEQYEKLDDEIEKHIKKVNNEKTKTRNRRPIQSSGSISRKKRSKQSSSGGSRSRKKEVRSQENGEDGSSRTQEVIDKIS